MDTAYKTTLELDKVLNRAVQLCACQETKEMMQALEPAPTIEDERYDLTQTNAINALLIKNGSPRFGSVREVRRIVAHARKGGILSMGELLEIAATLRNFSSMRCCPPTTCFLRWPRSRCWKSRFRRAFFLPRRWPTLPV